MSTASSFRPEPDPIVDPRPEAKAALGKLPYMDLLDYSIRLGRLKRPDRSRAFQTAGVLALGAGLGAWASGNSWDSKGVLLFAVVGVVLVLCSRAIKSENTEALSAVKADLDRMLSFYEATDPTLAKLRQDCERAEVERLKHEPIRTRVRRLLHMGAS